MAVKKDKEFIWHPNRRQAALLLSTGTMNNTAVAKEVGITPPTLSDWKGHPSFKAEIDRLTFLNELATRGGLMRLAMGAVHKKKTGLVEDRSTMLDWAKFIVDSLPEDTKQSDDKLKELTDAILSSAGKGK